MHSWRSCAPCRAYRAYRRTEISPGQHAAHAAKPSASPRTHLNKSIRACDMPKVVFINPDQTRVELDVPVGTSLMRAALANHVAGIIGDCGGGLTCATCHVLVDEEFLPKTPPMTANEDQMLDFT